MEAKTYMTDVLFNWKMIFLVFFFCPLSVFFPCWIQGVNRGELGQERVHRFPIPPKSTAHYRSSFPFRWIFKIFPSLCLAVAIPFFSRLARRRKNKVEERVSSFCWHFWRNHSQSLMSSPLASAKPKRSPFVVPLLLFFVELLLL